jgi:hypothetical protein
LVLENCSFEHNVNQYGYLLSLRDSVGSTILIQHNRFEDNFVQQGGALTVERWVDSSIFLVLQNAMVSNYAQQGGVMFLFRYSRQLMISNNTMANNDAELYGTTFASPPYEAIWIVPFDKSSVIYSGGRFPSFSLTCVDIFYSVTQPLSVNVDFFVASVTTRGETQEQGDGMVVKQDQRALLKGDKYISFTETEFVGNAGNYTLRIKPAINFISNLFTLESSFAVKLCDEPHILVKVSGEPYPRCLLRLFINKKTISCKVPKVLTRSFCSKVHQRMQ